MAARMLPYLEVAHLPSSSSFYSAVLQPLGLRYLLAEEGHYPSIIYGDTQASKAVFELRQITAGRERSLVPSHIILSAPSAKAADDCHAFAVRASPETRESSRHRPLSSWPATTSISATRTISGGGKTRLRIVDFDGNTMDIVYRPPSEYPPYYAGSTVRRTQSTNEEASRILDWNYDVASSDLRSTISAEARSSNGSTRSASRRSYGGRADEPYSTLRRNVTDDMPYEPTASPRQNSNGLNTSTVVGTLLGVAAGAALGGALTYNIVKGDRSRPPRQEFEPPAFARRSTFPNPHPQRKGGYIEVERAVDKLRCPDQYSIVVPDCHPASDCLARYNHTDAPRSREVVDDAYEETRGRRHHSSRPRASGRPRSEVASYRQPLLLHDTEHHSQASTRNSRHPPIVQRSYTYETPEGESYVSARSHRPSSTARPPPPQAVSRSKSGSRVTTATIRVASSSANPRAVARSNTYISSHDVSLPASGVGSSPTDWGYDDISIAPSDSISNVGSRRSGRTYH